VALKDFSKVRRAPWSFAGNLPSRSGVGRLNSQTDIANARNEQALQAYRAAVANASAKSPTH